jgi:phage shock protein A
MANPFVKGWKYLMALFDTKIEEKADPKVQIQQAMEVAQRQHQALLQQAAAVIGNQRQLEMKLSRQLTEVESMQAQARQALTLADQARAAGDPKKADDFERTAQTFATGLVAAESSLSDLKQLHDQALGAALQAREAVKNSDMMLKQKEAERTKLMSQLEQAKMQESVARSLESVSSIMQPGNGPSFDEVRDKIEKRYALALGRADLATDTVEGRRVEVQRASLDLAGATRLAEIRASMAQEITAAPTTPAVEAAAEATAEPTPAAEPTQEREAG